MMCDDARLLLHAYLDNELDAAQSVAIDRHMQGCAACAALHADYAQLHEGFARASLYRRDRVDGPGPAPRGGGAPRQR